MASRGEGETRSRELEVSRRGAEGAEIAEKAWEQERACGAAAFKPYIFSSSSASPCSSAPLRETEKAKPRSYGYLGENAFSSVKKIQEHLIAGFHCSGLTDTGKRSKSLQDEVRFGNQVCTACSVKPHKSVN